MLSCLLVAAVAGKMRRYRVESTVHFTVRHSSRLLSSGLLIATRRLKTNSTGDRTDNNDRRLHEHTRIPAVSN